MVAHLTEHVFRGHMVHVFVVIFEHPTFHMRGERFQQLRCQRVLNLEEKHMRLRIVLRWYGTPCNIFKDVRILKSDYNHVFKYFKIYNICPKNCIYKIPQER